MRTLYQSFVVLCFAACIDAQFSLYPGVSADSLAAAFNISSGCLTALNATVDCDQDLFSMAGNADGFFWSDDNATALCTSACQSAASSWWNNCANACTDDQLNAYGRVSSATWLTSSLENVSNIYMTRSFTLPRPYPDAF